jgi:hypothetical protein
VTQRSSVVTSAEAEPASGRGKGENDVSWADANLTRPKNGENSRDRFSCYKWTVKISINDELFFLKTYASEIYFCSSHRVEHNGENRILNGYHMSERNYFKVLLLCEMMC